MWVVAEGAEADILARVCIGYVSLHCEYSEGLHVGSGVVFGTTGEGAGGQ
jgi:hypothetical protein